MPREFPRTKVRRAYDEGGAEAALKAGRELSLKETKIQRWIKRWSTEPGFVSCKIIVKWTKRPVQLIAKGEQCSVVKFLDTGTVQGLSNEQIKFIEPPIKRYRLKSK